MSDRLVELPECFCFIIFSLTPHKNNFLPWFISRLVSKPSVCVAVIHGCNLKYWKVLTGLVTLTRWQLLNIVAEQGLSMVSLEKPSKSCVLKIGSILIESDNLLSSNCWWRPVVATIRCTDLALMNKQAVLWLYSSHLCIYIKYLCSCDKTAKSLPASSSTMHTGLHFTGYNCIIFLCL